MSKLSEKEQRINQLLSYCALGNALIDIENTFNLKAHRELPSDTRDLIERLKTLGSQLYDIGIGEDAATILGIKGERGIQSNKRLIEDFRKYGSKDQKEMIVSFVAACMEENPPILGEIPESFTFEEALEIAAKNFHKSPETIREYCKDSKEKTPEFRIKQIPPLKSPANTDIY